MKNILKAVCLSLWLAAPLRAQPARPGQDALPPRPAAAAQTALRELPAYIYGVTVDKTDDLKSTIASLRGLSHKPTARINFQESGPAEFREAVDRIHEVSFIMGELVDSFFMKDYDLAQYRRRAQDFLDAFGDKVDIWEIGNEINGDWLGDTGDVVRKMTAAYELVHERGGRTELTLHYGNGYPDSPEHEMFAWAEKNVPAEMKNGLDYVLVSYYEDDPGAKQPADWAPVFRRLGAMFPNAKVGFGEMGTEIPALKCGFIRDFYSKRVDAPRFVGGNFYWYFSYDMVPPSPLLALLDNPAAPSTQVLKYCEELKKKPAPKKNVQ